MPDSRWHPTEVTRSPVYDRHRSGSVGDLLFHRFHPFIDVAAGATTTGWQSFIETIAQRAPSDTRIIFAGFGSEDGWKSNLGVLYDETK